MSSLPGVTGKVKKPLAEEELRQQDNRATLDKLAAIEPSWVKDQPHGSGVCCALLLETKRWSRDGVNERQHLTTALLAGTSNDVALIGPGSTVGVLSQRDQEHWGR